MLVSLKKFLIFLLPLWAAILGIVFYLGSFSIKYNDLIIPHYKRLPLSSEDKVLEQEGENPKIVSDEEEPLPPEVLLDVPFAPQSPYALWDERDEESCEEASIVIVHYYWQKKDLTPALMRKELDNLITFQLQHYGDYKDSNVAEIARLASEYYGYQKVRVLYDINIDDIKREIAQSNPVIVPAAGRKLGNPYFTPPGPLYHDLVLIGFNEKGFITNDPGTRRGQNYFYPYDVLYNAIHDFPGSKEKIEEGRKAMIIIR